MEVPEPLTPERLEQCRRSLVMLTRGAPSGLDRDAALKLMDELQRLQGIDRRFTELVETLKALLVSAAGDHACEAPPATTFDYREPSRYGDSAEIDPKMTP